MFQPESLPGEYRADTPESGDIHHDIRWDIQWLYDHWEALNKKEKDTFYPYLALPDDPGSPSGRMVIPGLNPGRGP